MPTLDDEQKAESSSKTTANWIVLVVALAIAVAVWLVWVNFGISAIHRIVTTDVITALPPVPITRCSSPIDATAIA
jgi:hypothetical protein